MRSNKLVNLILFLCIIFILVYFVSFLGGFIFGRGVKNKKYGKIGLIEIKGIISSSEDIVEQVKQFEKDDSVKALVVRIDSPGGGVVPAQEIFEAITRFKEKTKKKVVASCGSMAASGGYYIACAADKIMSNPGTITGSIAVIIKIPNLQGLFEKIGFEEQIVKSGKHKDIGSFSRQLTKEERRILEKMIYDVHEQFIEAVSKGRNLDTEYVRNYSDGSIFSGRQAKELRLVDKLGTYNDALSLAKKLTGLPESAKIINASEKDSFIDTFRDLIDQKLNLNRFSKNTLSLQYCVY